MTLAIVLFTLASCSFALGCCVGCLFAALHGGQLAYAYADHLRAKHKTWTDPETGTRYALALSYEDRDGDTWALSGWLQWTDGTRMPLMTCREANGFDTFTDVELAALIDDYGPLTALKDKPPAESETSDDAAEVVR